PHGHAVRAVRALLLRDEERFVLVLTDRQIPLDRLAGRIVEIDAAVAAAFAEDGHLVDDPDAVLWTTCRAIELELTTVEADDLGAAATGRQQEPQQRPRPYALGAG